MFGPVWVVDHLDRSTKLLIKYSRNSSFFISWAHPPRENYFVSWSTLVYQISQTLMFHRFVFKNWDICCLITLLFWTHPPRENYFVSWSTLVYHISQTLMFHRFVFKVWKICWSYLTFLDPTTIILSHGLPWSMRYLKV